MKNLRAIFVLLLLAFAIAGTVWGQAVTASLVGTITDASGALAIYGAHILRSFMLGMEYASDAAGSAGDKFDFAHTQENTFKIDDCEV